MLSFHTRSVRYRRLYVVRYQVTQPQTGDVGPVLSEEFQSRHGIRGAELFAMLCQDAGHLVCGVSSEMREAEG